MAGNSKSKAAAEDLRQRLEKWRQDREDANRDIQYYLTRIGNAIEIHVAILALLVPMLVVIFCQILASMSEKWVAWRQWAVFSAVSSWQKTFGEYLGEFG